MTGRIRWSGARSDFSNENRSLLLLGESVQAGLCSLALVSMSPPMAHTLAGGWKTKGEGGHV